MAHTAHQSEEAIAEHFDSPELLDKHASTLAQWIKESEHLVAFTGAGISTSAGIPDFRGPDGTWTLKAQGKTRTNSTTSTLKAIPTVTHMSLLKLMNEDILKHLISQNCDGLHRRSGIKPESLSELHGNGNLEVCREGCGAEYMRDFGVSGLHRTVERSHLTGRLCNECQAPLEDTIINFGESLPLAQIEEGFAQSANADVHLVLGSSCTVSPACKMPKETAKRGGKLVICNLQKTPLDSLANLRIFAKTDDLMNLVMQKLGLDIPPFVLHRELVLQMREGKLQLFGQDVDGTRATFLSSVTCYVGAQELSVDTDAIQDLFSVKESFKEGDRVTLKLFFIGHYNEPIYTLNFTFSKESLQVCHLDYNPMTGVWQHEILPFEAKTKKPTKFNNKVKSGDAEDQSGNGHEHIRSIEVDNLDQIGNPFASGIMELLYAHYKTKKDVNVLMAIPFDRYFYSHADAGWGSGYRDLQSIISCIRNHRPDISPHVFPELGSGIPSIGQIQEKVEQAWKSGFDREGGGQFGFQLKGTKKFIGATDFAALFRAGRVNAELADFICISDLGPKHVEHAGLYHVVKNYFESATKATALPLYFQQEGHSYLIVGVECHTDHPDCIGENVILLLDCASDKEELLTSLSQSNLDLVRYRVDQFKDTQYQICFVPPSALMTDEEQNLSKVLSSEQILSMVK